MTKTVVVFGGSLGGLAVVHRLLKHTRPREADLRVILVSKNSHFYWNLASVRAIIPDLVKDEDLLQPIQPGLAQYPSGSVEFIVGAATGVDPASKTVVVDGAGEAQQRTVAYDYLVVATGADGADPDMPWKAAGSYQDFLASLHGTADRIRAGVEVAAEIKDAFLTKTVVLLNSGARLLGVEVRNVKASVDAGDGKKHVALSDVSEIVTDLYLPTTDLTPNSHFLPKALLTDKGYVDVDDCMRVRAAPDMWTMGDVVSKSRPGFLITDAQAAGVAKNIGLVLQGKSQSVVKGPPLDVFICSIGRCRGAGRAGPIPVPSLFVWAIKGRTLGMERTSKYADGTMF